MKNELKSPIDFSQEKDKIDKWDKGKFIAYFRI